MPKLDPAPDTAPERFETGTLDHEGIIGTRAAIDFLASLALATGTRRQRLVSSLTALDHAGRALLTRLWMGLAAIPAVTLYGPKPDRPRTSTLSFSYRGAHPDDVARHLARAALFASSGDFYASTVIAKVCPEGVVRAGCACYATEEEVDRFVEGVRSLTV